MRSRTLAHCRVICQTASHMRPPTIAIVPSTDTTIASHFGTPRRSIQLNAGHSRAVTRSATSSGITSSFSWMTSQIRMPTATASTTKRHAYAVATRRPRGRLASISVVTVRLRIASRNVPRSVSFALSPEPLIPPV